VRSISTKVDQATYDAFCAYCSRVGTNPNQAIRSFVLGLLEECASRPETDWTQRVAGPRPPSRDGAGSTELELLRQARVAAFMSAALVRHLDQGLFDRTAAELAAAAERFEATKQNGVQRHPLTAVSGGREARS
jgi:hypothetical protein